MNGQWSIITFNDKRLDKILYSLFITHFANCSLLIANSN